MRPYHIQGLHCRLVLQYLRRQMMPPILNSLGPITDWLSSRNIGSFSAKYDEVSRASSAAKVRQRPSKIPRKS